MAKAGIEKAMKSGEKWKSAQAARKVFSLTVLIFIGAVLGQLALIGKKKRYLFTFLLTVVGLVMGVMMAVRMAKPDDSMYTKANIVYYESTKNVQANEASFKCKEVVYRLVADGTLNYYMNGSTYIGAVVVFPFGRDEDGEAVFRFFTENGEISESVLETTYGRYEHSTDMAMSSWKMEYKESNYYQTWTYRIPGESQTRTLQYPIPRELVAVMLEFDEKSDVVYLHTSTFDRTTGTLGYSYVKSNVMLTWNGGSSRYESSGDYYIHSDKYDQTRTMMIVGFIIAGAGLLLMYVFLISQMNGTGPYLKYMKRCEKQLPEEARKDFRDRAQGCLRAGDMEGAKALLAEHRLI